MNKYQQNSVDYIRLNLLAKIGQENLSKENYREAINNLLEFFSLSEKSNFPDLQHLIEPCYFNLALAYSNNNDLKNAIIYWTKYIELNNSNFDAYLERLRAYFELEKFVEAIKDIDRALELKPNRDDLYINKGIALIKMGKRNNAKEALLKANALGNSDAQNNIIKYC